MVKKCTDIDIYFLCAFISCFGAMCLFPWLTTVICSFIVMKCKDCF